jgi:crotonobetainyl-CoA:carnitine CoA-transferase CaiB-like acyl-CoA transferase
VVQIAAPSRPAGAIRSKALEDVVVLDLTTQYCASVEAVLLRDSGAQVIRVTLERILDGGCWQ